MSKQEEIQKGLGIVTGDEQMAFAVMGYLHSEGVVIKGERDLLPDWDDISGCQAGWMKYSVICDHDDECFCGHRQKYLASLGYVPVEPLIKE